MVAFGDLLPLLLDNTEHAVCVARYNLTFVPLSTMCSLGWVRRALVVLEIAFTADASFKAPT